MRERANEQEYRFDVQVVEVVRCDWSAAYSTDQWPSYSIILLNLIMRHIAEELKTWRGFKFFYSAK